MERKIKITGESKLSVKPDMIILNLTFSKIKDTYTEAMETSIEQTNILQNCFVQLGFSKEDLKTKSFYIKKEFKNYYNKEKNWESKFVGYKFEHEMEIEFHLDNILYGKIIHILSECNVEPQLNIQYTIKDENEIKKKVLEKAIEDSKEKAQIIAKAAGIKLGNIIDINYSWETIDLMSESQSKIFEAEVETRQLPFAEAKEPNLDSTPQDIEISDNVTILWEIL